MPSKEEYKKEIKEIVKSGKLIEVNIPYNKGKLAEYMNYCILTEINMQELRKLDEIYGVDSVGGDEDNIVIYF